MELGRDHRFVILIFTNENGHTDWLRFLCQALPIMKRCSYCGAEYQDEMNKCPIDETPLEEFIASARRKDKHRQGRDKDATAFWEQVRERRNLFFLCWVGWLPVAGIFLGGYKLISGHEPPVLVGYSLFFSYAVIWYWTAWRLKQLRCPHCNKRAIAHPLFLMRHAECKHCGVTNEQA